MTANRPQLKFGSLWTNSTSKYCSYYFIIHHLPTLFINKERLTTTASLANLKYFYIEVPF
ncbi:hypothetical protein ACJX0J_035048, partial [Zea mays]